MRNKITNILSIILAIVVFILLIKGFYFDTDMGFQKQILELNYSAFPMWFDVLITTFVLPLIVYAGLLDLFDRIVGEISFRRSLHTN